MIYEIEYNIHEKRFYLIEYVGDEPCTYTCIAQYCWRDCVPCCYCEASEKIIKDDIEWEIWKEKYKNRRKFPTSIKHQEYFSKHHLDTKEFNDNYFTIVNGEAIPIQTTIIFN